MLSSEYGWTTEDILNLTQREISWRLNKIIDRKNSRDKFNAKIHGFDIKIPSNSNTNIQLSEEDNRAIENALKEAKIRKASQYGR